MLLRQAGYSAQASHVKFKLEYRQLNYRQSNGRPTLCNLDSGVRVTKG